MPVRILVEVFFLLFRFPKASFNALTSLFLNFKFYSHHILFHFAGNETNSVNLQDSSFAGKNNTDNEGMCS